MAFLLNKASVLYQLRVHSKPKTEDSLSLSRRGFHVEPGRREKALLAEDPSLKWFKSHKKGAWQIKRMGDVLTIVVVAGDEILQFYKVPLSLIYVRAVMREEARKQASSSA